MNFLLLAAILINALPAYAAPAEELVLDKSGNAIDGQKTNEVAAGSAVGAVDVFGNADSTANTTTVLGNATEIPAGNDTFGNGTVEDPGTEGNHTDGLGTGTANGWNELSTIIKAIIDALT